MPTSVSSPNTILASGALLATGLACTAPVSMPVEGPISEHVEAALGTGTASFDHSAWTTLLTLGTRDGLVDYGYFARHRGELEAYLSSLAGAEIATLEGDHLKALLINAYNAYTILSILDHPGIASIREIDGVWSTATHAVGGFELTLDQIEHNLLRPFFKDPRIHVAVNCASMSCAPLPPWAFEGDRLDGQLEDWTRRFFENPKYCRVEGGRLQLTKLLDWYGGDFVEAGWSPRAETLTGFVERYASQEAQELIAEHDGEPPIHFMPYDWSLNAAAGSDS